IADCDTITGGAVGVAPVPVADAMVAVLSMIAPGVTPVSIFTSNTTVQLPPAVTVMPVMRARVLVDVSVPVHVVLACSAPPNVVFAGRGSVKVTLLAAAPADSTRVMV